MDRPRCAYCHEIIGVYEPARVMLRDGTELKGSTLTLADQLEAPGSVALHADCYDPFGQSRARRRRRGRLKATGPTLQHRVGIPPGTAGVGLIGDGLAALARRQDLRAACASPTAPR